MRKQQFLGSMINYAKFLKPAHNHSGRFGIAVLLLFGLFSCSQKTEKQVTISNEVGTTLTVNPTDLPPPIKARYINLDSVEPPIVVPLKGKPKVVPAHPNVHPVGTPEVVQIPEEKLTIVHPGKEGVPVPLTKPATLEVVPALQPKPVPALAARYKDEAIFNINFLSDEQGLQIKGGTAHSGDMRLLEDSKGNIWIGGTTAIKYDGVNFYSYSKKEGFLSGSIYSMMEDQKGNIWFAGSTGICYYDGQTVTHLLRGISCQGVMEDSKGNIWFGFDKLDKGNGDTGIYCFDGEKFTIFTKEQGIYNDATKDIGWGSSINQVVSFFEDSKGHIWCGTNGSGVLRYDGQQFTHYTKKEGLIGNYIKAITEDDDGNLWFGSFSHKSPGLSCYQQNKNSSIDKGGTFTNYTNLNGLSKEAFYITDLVSGNEGQLWISAVGGGIIRFDGENFMQFKTTEGLGANNAYSLLMNRENQIWVSTSGGRVCQFKINSFQHFTESHGLSSDNICSIIEDQQGNIWIGTWDAMGIIKYDGKSFTYFTENEGLLSNEINDLLADSKGNIWMATSSQGICKFDGKVFTHYTPSQGLSGNWWWGLHEDKNGQIWVGGGPFGGVNRLNPETGQVTQFTNISKFKSTNNYEEDLLRTKGLGFGRMLSDSQGNLWIGTVGWVAKHDPVQDDIKIIAQVDTGKERFNLRIVRNLFEDDENLWFGSRTHFIKIKKNAINNNTYPQFILGNGLPDHIMGSVEVDQKGNIWFIGEGIGVIPNGLKQLGSSTLEWFHFQKADGLKSMSSHLNGNCLDSKNRLWFGSEDAGLAMLDLNNYKIPQKAPSHLSLSHIDLHGQFINYRNLSDSLYQSTLAFGESASSSFGAVKSFQNYPTGLALPYDLNHLTFHFSSKDWSAPHNIQYSYQIKELDKEWSPLTSEAKADYRNLPHGTFTFQVKAIGAAKKWSAPFEYTFTILSPWWHTWWAYCLYAIAAIGSIGWYVQRLHSKLAKEQAFNTKLTNLNKANSRFVPNDFLQILAKESILDLKLGDQTATKMTILFADIRDYTTISENMTPEQNFKFINAYLGQMGPIIKNNGGFICQYFGDGIMALFKDNHAQGVQAAIEMQKTLNFYNQTRLEQGKQAIQVGIGLNTGQLMLGVIGDENRYDSSVISDAVNTAARMEGLTKIFGCMLIISEPTLQELLLDDFPSSSNLNSKDDAEDKSLDDGKSSIEPDYAYRFLGKVKVKGKKVALNIYDFYDGNPVDIQQLKTATKADFEKALQLYFEKDFGKAADLLKVVLDKYPTDKAAQYYFDKAVQYVTVGVGETWSGVEEMVSK